MCCSSPCRRVVLGPSRSRRPRRCRRLRCPRRGPGGGTSGGRVPGGARVGGCAPGRVERVAGARVERGDRAGRRRDARLGARGARRRTGRAGRRAGRCRADRAAGGRAACAAHRRCGAREAVSAVAGRAAGVRARGRRDAGRDVRARTGSGACRDLGRRGRESQRAARAAAACAGCVAAAGRVGQVRVSVGELELHGGGRAAGGERVGAAVGRVARAGAGAAPLVRTVGDGDLARDEAARAARLPTLAWQAVREGLKHGPVLVQVPRRGYVPRMACAQCRAAARCRHCAGPLEGQDAGVLRCGWCGVEENSWHCPECGGFRLRAQIVGARRTAEELGRAFPAVPVRTSGREQVLDTVPGTPALVVSTPGAEPVADGGYAAALLLDGWAMLGRPDLRAGEDALRRWIAASSLVRAQGVGGLWLWLRNLPCGLCRRWCGGIPSVMRCGSLRSGGSWGFRRFLGWLRWRGLRGLLRSFLPLLNCRRMLRCWGRLRWWCRLLRRGGLGGWGIRLSGRSGCGR